MLLLCNDKLGCSGMIWGGSGTLGCGGRWGAVGMQQDVCVGGGRRVTYCYSAIRSWYVVEYWGTNRKLGYNKKWGGTVGKMDVVGYDPLSHKLV